MTTLKNSYCVPRDSEWDQFGIINMNGSSIWHNTVTCKVSDLNYPDHFKEIPVLRFLDLLHDRITPWRLDEIGWNFVDCKVSYHEFKPNDNVTLSWSEKNKDAGVAFELDDDATWLNITTFTDL